MATGSVCEHPVRFLVAILESFTDKLPSHAGFLVRPRLGIFDRQSKGRTSYCTALLFDLVKLAGVRLEMNKMAH